MSVECIYVDTHTKYKAENSKSFAKLLSKKLRTLYMALLTETFGTVSSTN